MSGECIKITADFLNIDRNVRCGLRSIYHADGAVTVCFLCNPLHRIGDAENVADITDGDNLCAVCNLRADLLFRQCSVKCRLHVDQLRALLPAHHLPGKNVGVMLHNGNDNLIVLSDMAEAIAVGHQIQPFCCISCKNNLFLGSCMNKITYCRSGVLTTLGSLQAERIKASQRVRIFCLIKNLDCIQYSLRALGCCCIIYINRILIL